MGFKEILEKLKIEQERRAKLTQEERDKEDQDKYDRDYPWDKKVRKLEEYLTEVEMGLPGSGPDLSDWEAKFIRSVYTQMVIYYKTPSDKQLEVINKLHKKYIKE